MEQRVHKVASSSISDKKMGTIMFAIIATNANLLDTYTLNRDKVKSGNFVKYLLSIPDSQIAKFEELTKIKLEEPQKITLSYAMFTPLDGETGEKK